MKQRFPIIVLLVGLSLLYPLQAWIDRSSPRDSDDDETLYLSSGPTIKKMSLGLDALAADVYWIRTVQYFGRKLIDSRKPLSSGATKDIRMDLLAPLLRIVVTLDPHHIPAYRFGAIFLPERDLSAAISLLEEGIRQNPEQWRLYQDLGYIYWQAGNGASSDQQNEYYSKASEWFERGSQVPGALWWMHDLSGLMKIRGGDRQVARAIYSSYVNSDDELIRSQAHSRLKQLQALDELDAINDALAAYRKEQGECPADLRVLAPKLAAVGLTLDEERWPLDPDGFPYVLDRALCRAALMLSSTVPR